MGLSRLSIIDFRNLVNVQLYPLVQGFNFLYGQNGSGKTSCLEAIYYLGHKRSFRSLSANRIIRYSSDKFNIFSEIADHFGQSIPLGIERLQSGECRVRAAGKDVSTIIELASFLPIRLINVHSHYLLEGSPVFRRKYMDWGLFYQNNEFQVVWLRFKRVLQQRNAALRARASYKELSSWTKELIEAALLFHALRVAYINELLPLLGTLLSSGFSEIVNVSSLEMSYQAGWKPVDSYEKVLANSLPKDLEQGYTQYGPHRADLNIKLGSVLAKDVLSTGQQKLLVCGMILAQGLLLAKSANKKPIYLVDDLPAELDRRSRNWLVGILAEQRAQVFVTAVEQEAMGDILTEIGSPTKMFHVKQGEIE